MEARAVHVHVQAQAQALSLMLVLVLVLHSSHEPGPGQRQLASLHGQERGGPLTRGGRRPGALSSPHPKYQGREAL